MIAGFPRGRSAGDWKVEADEPAATEFPRRVRTVTFSAPARQPAVAVPSAAASPFSSPVKSWRYQLQNVNPAEIANSTADLVVIDSSSNDAPFTKAQVERMKVRPDGSRRIVVSYMSIGEAENYRWYWSQRSSSWLGAENPKWRGNYAVRFWDRAWQEIIFSYADRILAAGFDGVYLDKVDEFETMGHRDDMVELVTRIAARAKSQRAASWSSRRTATSCSPIRGSAAPSTASRARTCSTGRIPKARAMAHRASARASSV
jgi:uncharacterized protein (TIGR01370 family)